MRFVYILWCFQLMVSSGLETNKLLSKIESRLQHFETRLNLEMKDLEFFKDTVQILNNTSAKGTETVCQNTDESKGLRAMFVSEVAGTKKFKQKILQAQREEKMWIRNELTGLKKRANGLETSLELLKNDFKKALNTCYSGVETLENQLKQLTGHEIHQLKAMLNYTKEELIKMKKDVLSSSGQTQEEVKVLKENVDDIKAELIENSKHVQKLEANIYDKIMQKLQTELKVGLECSSEWWQIRESCFKFHDQRVTFDTASEICTNENASVAELQSEDENEYLKTLTDKKIWIGISDREKEGEWVSVKNGKPLIYSKWDKGQPQNFAAYDEDCAATSATGLWHDYKCSQTFTFVCKKMAMFRTQA